MELCQLKVLFISILVFDNGSLERKHIRRDGGKLHFQDFGVSKDFHLFT